MPPEQPEQPGPSYDSAAAARDMMTRQLILAMLQGGGIVNNWDTVDDCRKLAKYIQDTNEEILY